MITICYISKDRPNHLKRSVRSLFSQTIKPEHIVITDCSDNKIDMEMAIEELKKESEIPITYVWKSKEELSRSQGRNLGREYVKTLLMVSTEGDIICPPTLIEECLKVFSNPPKKIYVQPYKSYQNEHGEVKDYRKEDDNGFFQAFRTEDFDSIGGYNPFFNGWGHEDIDFLIRMKNNGCRKVIVPVYVEHMWHKSYQNMEEYNKNMKIAEESKWNYSTKQWIRINR